MRPTRQLLIILLVWCSLGLIQGTLRLASYENALISLVWQAGGIALFVILFIDYFSVGKIGTLAIQRQVSTSLALGAASKVTLSVKNTLERNIQILISEAPNQKLNFTGLPATLLLNPKQAQTLDYTITPIRRGDTVIAPPMARITSKYGLWDFTSPLGNESRVKIYPNFSPIAHMANLGIEQQVRQLGVHLSQRRGEGMEFKQLREFIEGDSLRQIDWKATARSKKPISREYQDEKNQELYFLLDCGRRLRHKDDELSHFDHALNAILLTSYIAIRQGDACGFSSYSGPEKWLSPVRGNLGVNTLLNTLYDLESTLENTDFLKLAEDFNKKNRRRSLVIIVSNIREEDYDDLIKATQLLSKNHVVLIASLKELSLVQQLDQEVSNFEDALSYSETHQYLSNRQFLVKKLRSSGVHIIDTLPNQLHVQLVTEYFRLKRSHLL